MARKSHSPLPSAADDDALAAADGGAPAVQKPASPRAQRPTDTKEEDLPPFVYYVAMFAALNSMNLGYDIGVNSGVGYHLQAEGEGMELSEAPRPRGRPRRASLASRPISSSRDASRGTCRLQKR